MAADDGNERRDGFSSGLGAAIRVLGGAPPVEGMIEQFQDANLGRRILNTLASQMARSVGVGVVSMPQSEVDAARAIVGALGYESEKDMFDDFSRIYSKRWEDPARATFIARLRRMKAILDNGGPAAIPAFFKAVDRQAATDPDTLAGAGEASLAAPDTKVRAPLRPRPARRRADALPALRPVTIAAAQRPARVEAEVHARWASSLIDEATAAHEGALEAVRARIVAAGMAPLASLLIDLAWQHGEDRAAIAEAKSITPSNESDQVMAAFGQLRRYSFLYKDEPAIKGREVDLWVILSAPPSDPLTREFLAHEGIRLVWLESGALAGPDADALPRPAVRVRLRRPRLAALRSSSGA